MIIRILGDGQYLVPDSQRPGLDAHEEVLSAALDSGDEAGFAAALAGLLAEVRAAGERVDELVPPVSDLVLPADGSALAEVAALLAEGPLGQ